VSGALLVRALAEPASVTGLSAGQWNGLISAARAERLIGTLAYRLHGVAVPPEVAPVLADARDEAVREARQALWEADRARVALAPLGVPFVLLKGTAYVTAGLKAGEGRFVGDLDILVPRAALDDVEAALLAAGWEWVKPDPYDDAYYRQWMHELPPMIHRERDRMIDVHHTILPLTARQRPDAEAMITDSVKIGEGLRILSPEDRVCHAAAHLLADGDLAGGLRNLWDIHCLVEGMDERALMARAERHGLERHVAQALRLARALYAQGDGVSLGLWDRLVWARLIARDGWGRETHKLLRFALFVRSHWLRMPPVMLARHLWTKWRKGHRPQ
jgi:hypothetical protein